MIQRIQSVYLFLAAIICIIFLFVPIATLDAGSVTPNDNTITSAISIACALLSFVAIFFYKDRKRQIRFCFIIIALLFVCLASAYFSLTRLDTDHTITAFIAIPLIAILFIYLAMRSIRKDEQLVKSMDRFR